MMNRAWVIVAFVTALLVASPGLALLDDTVDTVEDTVEDTQDTVDNVTETTDEVLSDVDTDLETDTEAEDLIEDTLEEADDLLYENVYSIGDPIAVAQVTVDGDAAFICSWAKEGFDDEHSTDCDADGQKVADNRFGSTYTSEDVQVEGDTATLNVTLVDLGPRTIHRTAIATVWSDGTQYGTAEVQFPVGATVYVYDTWDEGCKCYVFSHSEIDYYKDWQHVEFEVPTGNEYHVEVLSAPFGQDVDLDMLEAGVWSQDASAPFHVDYADGAAPAAYEPASASSGAASNLATVLALSLIAGVAVGAIGLRRWL